MAPRIRRTQAASSGAELISCPSAVGMRMVPKPSTDTLQPVFPKVRYFIKHSLLFFPARQSPFSPRAKRSMAAAAPSSSLDAVT